MELEKTRDNREYIDIKENRQVCRKKKIYCKFELSVLVAQDWHG